MKLLLPDTISVDESRLPEAIRPVAYSPGDDPVPFDDRDAVALVAWGNRPHQLASFAHDLPHLRWVQSLAAGPDAVLAAGFGPEVVITSGRGLHDTYVAEHALALTLASIRRIPAMVRAQQQRRWATELGGSAQARQADKLWSLTGARVTVWGFGGIGRRLASYLAMLGAEVTGIARTPGIRGGFPVVGPEGTHEVLRSTDILIMVLPNSPHTREALDAEAIRSLRQEAFVVNVGRGSTIDEGALIRALAAGELAGAALDVFAEEPLPEDSELWKLPNVLVSPHAAGGRPLGASDLIAENAAAFVAGRALVNVVPREGSAPF